MNEWKPFVGRISFFPEMAGSSPLLSPLELYKKIWSGDPDSFHKQDNALMPTVAQGKRGSLMVNCMVHPARIDFNLTAARSQVRQMTLDLIDHPIELRDELMRIMHYFSSSFVLDHVSRVALNLQFLNLQPSHVEANKALIKAIPNRYGVTITDEEDFVFQINQPHKKREFQDITMNFITKWSVERFQLLTVSIPLGNMPVQPDMTLMFSQPKPVIAASVAFDNNNTPPTPGRTLTSNEQSALLQEAWDEAARKQLEIGLNIEGF
jgi:hypothetical protein